MDFIDEELFSLWNALQDNEVKYILVGGFATVLNGYSRLTADVDIWIKDTKENREALQKSLIKIGLTLPNIENIDFVPGWSAISLPSGFELDIMTSLAGFEQSKFDDSYEIANEAIIEGVSIRFFHINQLIYAKKASNRPKDQLDVEELEKIKKQNQKE
ncbi:MAG: DUF6036 family nucleotidyltransferase [Bacteroidota bacterium]|nr:DUF6036 family nucleotidyltransferase [Bacteroidota bacterium]